MRVCSVLLRHPGRWPPKEPFAFKESFPLQIKNEVSGRGEKTSDVSCLQEMAVMFACMKKNDFKEVKCSAEIEVFTQCYTKHNQEKAELKKREESGKIVTGRNSRNLTTKQLNQLLKKHPQFNEKLF